MIITNLEDNCKHLQSMTINVLIQLKGIIERALSSTAKLSKSFRKFYSEAMILFITMFGRINYSAMARSSDYCESRFRQNFKKEFDWIKFNAQFVKKGGSRRNAIAIDPSYIDKSGKKIPGLGYFWSGCAKMAKWGLEILGIAFIDADTKKAVHLRAVQTFKDKKQKGRKPAFKKFMKKEDGLICKYLEAIYKYREELLKLSSMLVADAYFANGPFVKGLRSIGFHLISRLHDNAKMKYLYTGSKSTGRGRPKKYDGYVDLDSLRPGVFSAMVLPDENGDPVIIHVGNVWVDCLKMECKVVVACYTEPGKKKQTRKVYFCTDTSMEGKDIFDLYRTRFQIEFLYRSGKGLTGLTHCQARNEKAQDFAFNMSLSSINVMREFASVYGYERLSDNSIKMLMHNAFMLERFISVSGVSPKRGINDTDFKELLFHGVRDAS